MRYIGMDVHRDFAQLAVVEEGLVRDEGRIGVTPEALREWGAALRRGVEPSTVVELAECGAMTVRLIRSNRLFPGAPYAYAATVDETGLIFTAGACPLDEHGVVITPGDVAAQMRQALANLRAALAESGLEITDILKTTIYVATSDRQDLLAAWNEVTTVFGKHDVPSTLLGVAVLGYADQLVEIEAVAAARGRSSDQ